MFHSSPRSLGAALPRAVVTARLTAAERAQRSDDASRRLRVEALHLTAPWLAALSAGAAVAVTWGMTGAGSRLSVALWAMLVVAVNIVAVRARRRAASAFMDGFGRSAHWAIAEAGLHACLWGMLPLVAFSDAGVQAKILLAGAIVTMMAGAALLAAVPLAATLWVALLAGLLGIGIDRAGIVLPAPMLVLLPAYVGVILIGCLAMERLLTRHIALATDERTKRETIGLLLKEYEDQGVGWVWQVDAANLLTYVSPFLCGLMGRATGQLSGQSLPVMLGCDPRLGGALVAREPFNGIEIEVATAFGQRCLSLSGTPIIDPAGIFHGFRGVGSDVTEVRRSEERLTELASIDVLTGLPNRHRMRELFAAAVADTHARGEACAILFLDLDGFKPVNDTFGHPVGDQVLRAIAGRLKQEVAEHGQIGRVGGDEFALLLTGAPTRAAVAALGRRLIDRVAEPVTIDRTEIRIGLSIGCAFAPVDGQSVDELLLKADLALYEAKSQGRGRLLTFDSKMQSDAEDRLRLEQDLRQALGADQFILYYQPIVSAQTQAIVGFEALLRWKHPERGMVPPGDFIPLTEETGLIGDIGEWVLRTACRDAAQWPGGLFVSVNVSPRQLVLPALPNAVSKALTATRLPPNRLELEVTESVFLSDADGSLDVLRRVRALGVGIALDDFGTGYSSLGYLNKTIFHTLKIDGSFVRDAGRKPETVPIIHAIVSLANSFRMTITAEGVETPEDYERMRDFGCHKIQGYLFGRPMTFDRTLALFATPLRRVS